MQSRIEVFQEMARQQPDDVMVWYGLASEYTKLERWSEAAEALSRVVRLNPDYTAAFQMLGTAYMNLGKPAEARRAWTEGIEAANRTGAWKARQHMEGLLADSGAEAQGDFCQE
jgi:predicted Zn-dependent protease